MHRMIFVHRHGARIAVNFGSRNVDESFDTRPARFFQ
jgi:hypothetical protein